MGGLNSKAVVARAVAVVGLSTFSIASYGITYDLDWFGGVDGALNTTVTLGAGWRMEDRSARLVGRSNLNPNVCYLNDQGGNNQQCQATFRDQLYPSQAAAAAPPLPLQTPLGEPVAAKAPQKPPMRAASAWSAPVMFQPLPGASKTNGNSDVW